MSTSLDGSSDGTDNSCWVINWHHHGPGLGGYDGPIRWGHKFHMCVHRGWNLISKALVIFMESCIILITYMYIFFLPKVFFSEMWKIGWTNRKKNSAKTRHIHLNNSTTKYVSVSFHFRLGRHHFNLILNSSSCKHYAFVFFTYEKLPNILSYMLNDKVFSCLHTWPCIFIKTHFKWTEWKKITFCWNNIYRRHSLCL